MRRFQEKKLPVYCQHPESAFSSTDAGIEKMTFGETGKIDVLNNSVDCCGLVRIYPSLEALPRPFYPSQHGQRRVVFPTLPSSD